MKHKTATCDELIESDQSKDFAATSSTGQTKLEKEPTGLWDAVRTVVKTQRKGSPIKPISRSKDLLLSFAQQRLWCLNQLEPNNSANNIPKAVRLSGVLDKEALQKAFDAIVSRHEALRATYVSLNGKPMQVIAESQIVEMLTIDLSQQPAVDRETEVQRLLTKEIQRPFDLSCDLMLRTMLLRLDDQEHVLLIVMHHIAADGWSMGILFRELVVLYEAFSTGSSLSLKELPIQYADFAHWQQQWLQGEVLEAQLFYWKQQLGNNPTALELPTNRPRPPVQTFWGARQAIVLSKFLSASLKALGHQERVTLFMTLLVAFQTLLHRYT